MSKDSEESMKLLKKELARRKKARQKTKSRSSTPLCPKEGKIHTERELWLENDKKLQNHDLKFWPILSILDTDFLLQIEKILLYGCSEYFTKRDSALIVTKDKNVYIMRNETNQFEISSRNNPLQLQKVKALCQKNIKAVISTSDPCFFVLTEEGKIYSWGNNKGYKLGHGTILEGYALTDELVTYPLEVIELADKYIVDIKCGHFHVLVLTDDGKVYSWGRNDFGQVGETNIGTIQLLPMEVIIEDEKGKKNIESISCGCTFSMVITCDGELYGWGDNSNGQLGLGDNAAKDNYRPMKIELDVAIDLPMQSIPLIVSNFGVSAKIECGYSHTLALSQDGMLYVWGQNDQGQLGTGTYEDVHRPILMDSTKMGKVTNIACQFYSKKSAAISEDKRIYVWGYHADHNIMDPIVVNVDNIQDVFMDINVFHKPCLVKVEKQSNVVKCLETAFNNSETADIQFIVDGQLFHIHRTIIMIHCPEMYRLAFACNTNKVISRNDFSAASYKAFFKYLYTDVIDISNENTLELFNLAIFYQDKILAISCIRMIKEMLNISNVIYFYATAISSEVKELEEFCFKYAINNLTAVVKTKSFADLSENVRLDFIIKAADAGAFKH